MKKIFMFLSFGLSLATVSASSKNPYEARVIGKKRYHGTVQRRVFWGDSDRSLSEARKIAWQKCSRSEMTSCVLESCVERGVEVDSNDCRSSP